MSARRTRYGRWRVALDSAGVRLAQTQVGRHLQVRFYRHAAVGFQVTMNVVQTQAQTIGQRPQAHQSFVEALSRDVFEVVVERIARRHLEPGQVRREHRREGFEAASADRIFESTFTAQAGKRGA